MTCLTSSEAAARLGISRRHLDRLVADGALVPLRRTPRQRHFFELAEVERCAATRGAKTTWKSRAGNPARRRAVA